MIKLKNVLLDREQLFLLDQLLLMSLKDLDMTLLYTVSERYIMESNEDILNNFKKLLDVRFYLYEYIHSVLVSLDNENKDIDKNG